LRIEGLYFYVHSFIPLRLAQYQYLQISLQKTVKSTL
jgi:hypothetical protein